MFTNTSGEMLFLNDDELIHIQNDHVLIYSNIKDVKDASGQEDMSKALLKSEDLMSEQNSESSDVEFVRDLHDHQRSGTAFMYGLFPPHILYFNNVCNI